MAEDRYRHFARRLVPTVLRGYFGERLSGVAALVFDLAAQGIVDAVRAPWINAPGGGPALDANGPLGEELSLPQYPTEADANYRQRLAAAWDDWVKAGDENVLLSQLALAGWPGAILLTPHELPTADPIGYWSQFWVLWPPGTHTVTAGAKQWDTFNWDDGTIYDAQGITAAEITLLRALVRKWKPAHWICRSFIFVVEGWLYDDGHNWDDTGLDWDGISVVAPV